MHCQFCGAPMYGFSAAEAVCSRCKGLTPHEQQEIQHQRLNPGVPFVYKAAMSNTQVPAQGSPAAPSLFGTEEDRAKLMKYPIFLALHHAIEIVQDKSKAVTVPAEWNEVYKCIYRMIFNGMGAPIAPIGPISTSSAAPASASVAPVIPATSVAPKNVDGEQTCPKCNQSFKPVSFSGTFCPPCDVDYHRTAPGFTQENVNRLIDSYREAGVAGVL